MYGFVLKLSVGTQPSFLSAADYTEILGNWWSSFQKFPYSEDISSYTKNVPFQVYSELLNYEHHNVNEWEQQCHMFDTYSNSTSVSRNHSNSVVEDYLRM